jgi:hypothetical protein
MDNPFAPDYREPESDDTPSTITLGNGNTVAGTPADHITYHEWLAQRCGLLTASEMKLIITPTLKVADNDKTRAHLWELLFQRLTGFVEPQYVSDAMLRGQEDEIYARAAYASITRRSPRSASSRTTNGASRSAIRRTGWSATTA